MAGALAPLEAAQINPLPMPDVSADAPRDAAPGAPAGMARAPRRLSRRQKAAVLVRLFLAEGIPISLKDLPEQLQAQLTHEMAQLRFVDRTTLRAVIKEFVDEIEEIGLSFPGGIEKAIDVLGEAISPVMAARLRHSTGARLTRDPWEALCEVPPERLLPIVEAESTEVAAVLMSKIKVSAAAEMLSQLPGPRARAITYAVSQTAAIRPEVVERIGESILEQLEGEPPTAFDSGPVERIGAILNFSPAATRDAVLEGLEAEDAAFANEVRKAIFTFAHISSRVDPRDVPKIIREVDQAQLVTALAAATDALAPVAEFILSAMSKRMAEQLQDEIAEAGTVKAADGEAAMNAIVSVIRDLEARGELFLVANEDE